MDKPRVKPLEWEEDPRAGWKRGRIVGLSPTAKQEATIFRVESGWQYKGDVYLTAHDGLDAALDRAKAAAQADYEACVLAALEPVTVQEAARDDALTALGQLEAVEDAYTRWMLANAVGDPDLVHRDGNKLSKALFAMLNDGPDDGPSTILRALRALAEKE